MGTKTGDSRRRERLTKGGKKRKEKGRVTEGRARRREDVRQEGRPAHPGRKGDLEKLTQ